MKTHIKIFLFILVFFVPAVALAASDDHGLSVEDIIAGILDQQGAESVNAIDCDSVDDEDFEALGDAVMGLMHPNPEEHELMDDMMGGEGSESLRAAHVFMGKRYLGCADDYGMGMGMMGPGMMGSFAYDSNNGPAYDQNGGMYSMMGMPFFGMMGGSSGAWIAWIFTAVAFLAFILSILWLMKSIWQKDGGAREILHRRYAAGEISKKEYESMKKEIERK